MPLSIKPDHFNQQKPYKLRSNKRFLVVPEFLVRDMIVPTTIVVHWFLIVSPSSTPEMSLLSIFVSRNSFWVMTGVVERVKSYGGSVHFPFITVLDIIITTCFAILVAGNGCGEIDVCPSLPYFQLILCRQIGCWEDIIILITSKVSKTQFAARVLTLSMDDRSINDAS